MRAIDVRVYLVCVEKLSRLRGEVKPISMAQGVPSMKVLVIDDNPAVRDMVAVALARAGHDAVVANNGWEGLALAERESIDAVVTDVFMPECVGIEVVRALRERRRGLPLVAMSGGSLSLGQEFLKMAEHLGASATLRKPFEPRELVAVLEALGRRVPA